MLNRTYNNIIRLIGFTVTMGFVVLEILGIIDKSWWYILIPIVLTWFFARGEEEHIYIVRNAEEIEEIEGIDEDDVEPENDDSSEF